MVAPSSGRSGNYEVYFFFTYFNYKYIFLKGKKKPHKKGIKRKKKAIFPIYYNYFHFFLNYFSFTGAKMAGGYYWTIRGRVDWSAINFLAANEVVRHYGSDNK